MSALHWLWHFMIWGAGYQITSGPIIVGGLWHHFNCHEDGCKRIHRSGKTYCRRCEKRRKVDVPR